MSDIVKNRYDVVGVVEAVMCNPNGDPNADNQPRVDYDTNKGIITDVAMKSRIRAYVANSYAVKPGFDIFMKRGSFLNKAIMEARVNAESLGMDDKVTGTGSKDVVTTAMVDTAQEDILNRFWDVRTFGGVLSTGVNAGQVRGPVQISFATSVNDVEVVMDGLTRGSSSDAKGKNPTTMNEMIQFVDDMGDDKKRTMGHKYHIPYGLYVVKMTVSGHLAEKCHFTEEDLQILFEAFIQMYNTDASSSKMGMSVISPVVVFKHIGVDCGDAERQANSAKLGCAPSYKLFEMVDIKQKDGVEIPRSYHDFDMKLHMENLPDGVVCGLKTTPFCPIEWLDSTDTIDLETV